MTPQERANKNPNMAIWYIVGDKLFFTRDAAETWQKEVDNTPIEIVMSVAYKQRLERERLRGKK